MVREHCGTRREYSQHTRFTSTMLLSTFRAHADAREEETHIRMAMLFMRTGVYSI